MYFDATNRSGKLNPPSFENHSYRYTIDFLHLQQDRPDDLWSSGQRQITGSKITHYMHDPTFSIIIIKNIFICIRLFLFV